MILVTCAGGRTGKAIVAGLSAAGDLVRGMVKRPESAAALYDAGVTQIATGDLAIADDVARAIEGVDAVYYIAPNMTPDERAMGDNVVAAAKEAGIERLVFHSVLHTQIEALPHHWERHFVEQAIIDSGLPFVILQCGSYMQNMLPGWKRMMETGVHRMAYDVDAPMSLVDLADVAEIAVKVLTDSAYENGIYEIAGPAITLREKAEILSDVTGRPITAGKEPLEEFLAHGRALGFSDYTLATMAKMFPYYDAHGLVASPKVLEWLLGRPPTDFRAFVRRTAAAYERVARERSDGA
jgi:uncharacterized protein YbjT (DUF2867 family)